MICICFFRESALIFHFKLQFYVIVFSSKNLKKKCLKMHYFFKRIVKIAKLLGAELPDPRWNFGLVSKV